MALVSEGSVGNLANPSTRKLPVAGLERAQRIWGKEDGVVRSHRLVGASEHVMAFVVCLSTYLRWQQP